MLKNVTQRIGFKAHVVGIEHGPQHGDCQSTLKGLGYIGGNESNGIAFAHPPLCQGRGETLAPGGYLAPVTANAAVYLGG